jgi:hypothetical protein
MKRLLFLAAALLAVVVYCILGAYHFFDWEEEDANAAKVIDAIRATGPGWQR